MSKTGDLHSSVHAANGVVYVQVVGMQTRESVLAVVESSTTLINRCLLEQPYVDMLVDFRYTAGHNMGARHVVVSSVDLLPCRRIAMFGADPIFRVVIRLITKGAQTSERMRYFNSEEDARSWLSEVT